MSGGLPDDLAAAVALGGEMGRRFNEFDWAAHPLGRPRRGACSSRSRRAWLRAIAVDPAREHDILLASGQAVTNAIEHGSHCDARKTVSIEAFLQTDTVTVTVSDSGRWAGDSSASQRSRRRGRGLTLISGLADHVDTVRTPGGTQVTLWFEHAVPG